MRIAVLYSKESYASLRSSGTGTVFLFIEYWPFKISVLHIPKLYLKNFVYIFFVP